MLSTYAVPVECTKSNADETYNSNQNSKELTTEETPIANQNNNRIFSVLPSQRGFKMASLNINHLLAHIDELRILLASNDIDIIAINETKLDEDIKDDEVKIQGYEIARRDRDINGGGICFYVKTPINFIIRKDLKFDSLENLCLEIQKPRSKPFVVVTWYRPPDSLIDIFSHFETLIGKLDAENTEFYLLGDLNCDMVATRYDNHTNKLISIADVYGLQQLITEPTRVTPTSATLIDLIYTNCPDKITCSGVRHISISDHCMVFAYRKLSGNGISNGHNTITYRNFRKFNRDNFRNDIASQSWDELYNSNNPNPNEMWLLWKGIFLSIVDKHAPLRNMRVRARSSPWITAELKKLMHDRDILKIKVSKSNDPNEWAHFRKRRNAVNREIRLAKQAYFQNNFTEHMGDSKKTWRTINELTSRKSGKTSVTSLNVNGSSITDPSEVSNEFNNHFATIGPKLASDIDSSDSHGYQQYLTCTNQQFQFRPTTTSKVLSLLNKLNKTKATGLDRISARLIRECADLICIPICDIFNQSINQGVFPDDWKSARVTPLFKHGNRDDVNNYRPISIISAVAKVFERLIYDQVYAYLEEHQIISKHQSGFRTIHSTVTALLEATDTWAYNIDRGKVNAVVFLDLKKAFDTVDHQILLSKLSFYGIHGNELQWFKSYLENRTQICSINGIPSNTCTLSCGVPQGTILGPLLFLLYINDLPNCLLNCEPRMYADDTHLTFACQTVDDMQSCLNQDLENVYNWLKANKLTLNMTKTEFMLIGSRQRLCTLTGSPTLSINDTPVRQVTTAKSLGVTIDDKLVWNSHIEKLTKKVASGIGAIKRVRHLVPQATLHLIYRSLVQPHFDYCNIVWGNCGVTLNERLQKLQNRAARVLTFSNYDADASPLLEQLGWKSLSCQQQSQRATMVFKSLHGLAPEYLCDKFDKRETLYNLRDSGNKLNVPLPRTNYYKNSFTYSGATLWNSLPSEVRHAESLGQFKSALKSVL